MVTGVPSIDNGLHDITDNIIASLEKSEQFKKEMIVKLKKANRSEREFIMFKLFFGEITCNEKQALKQIIKEKPFFFHKLWDIIDEAIDARQSSKNAIYNRSNTCIEIMKLYKLLLDKMSKLAKELTLNNSLELSVLFSYLLWNGYLSKIKKHNYEENNDKELWGLLFVDVINGNGVCRNYSEMLKDFLNNNGYNSLILANNIDDNIKVNYSIIIDRRNSNNISNISEKRSIKKKEANHVFNLIEDNGLYIYDPTNLLLYNLQNKNISTLVNGNGKNIIFPYRSYDFCYSKEDEVLLDKFFSSTDFVSPYNKTDFISISEVTLELIKNNRSLLEDFYSEAKPDILGISEETKKVLTRIK